MNLHSILSRLGALVVLTATVLLTGCATTPLGTPVASIDSIQAAKASGMAPVATGEFKLAPGKDPQIDKSVGIRATTVTSPIDDSFARYLRETLRVELSSAGLLDPSSKTMISGALTENLIDSSSSQGKGSLGARFVATREGRTLYDKELRVESTWESSFVGAIAIPAARNEYTDLYRKLVRALLTDPAFKAALAK